jgi:hypothetical protein
MMPMLTILYREVQTSIHKDNTYWNILYAINLFFNKGNELSFVINSRTDVNDLILQPNKRGNLKSNWHVSGETSLSDHRYIGFRWVT